MAALGVHTGFARADDAFAAFTGVRIGVIPAALLSLICVAALHAQALTEVDTTRAALIRWLDEEFTVLLTVLNARLTEKFRGGVIVQATETWDLN